MHADDVGLRVLQVEFTARRPAQADGQYSPGCSAFVKMTFVRMVLSTYLFIYLFIY